MKNFDFLKKDFKAFYEKNPYLVYGLGGAIVIILVILLVSVFNKQTIDGIDGPNENNNGNGGQIEAKKEVTFKDKLKQPADKWFDDLEKNKGKIIDYNGLDVYIDELNRDSITNNVATKETIDNVIERLKELGINKKDNSVKLTSSTPNQIYNKSLILEVRSKKRMEEIKKIDETQKSFVEKSKLSKNEKDIVNSIFENEKILYAVSDLSPGDYYSPDMLGIKKQNSGAAITAFDFTSANQILSDKGKIITQNTGKMAVSDKVLNTTDYMDGKYSFDNIYTLSSFFLLYPETHDFLKLINTNKELKKEFVKYLGSMLDYYNDAGAVYESTINDEEDIKKLNPLEKKLNENKKKKNKEKKERKDVAPFMLRKAPEEFYNLLEDYTDTIEEFVLKNYIDKDKREIYNKVLNKEMELLVERVKGTKKGTEEEELLKQKEAIEAKYIKISDDLIEKEKERLKKIGKTMSSFDRAVEKQLDKLDLDKAKELKTIDDKLLKLRDIMVDGVDNPLKDKKDNSALDMAKDVFDTIKERTEEFKGFLKNFHKFAITYLLYEDLEDKDLYAEILPRLKNGGLQSYAGSADRPYFNYDAKKSFKPFLYDNNTDEIISEPENDTLDLTGLEYNKVLEESDTKKIGSFIKSSPVCKRIDNIGKRYIRYDIKELKMFYSCQKVRMLHNYSKMFVTRLFAKGSGLFELVSTGDAKILDMVGFSALVKTFPDVFYWGFDTPEERKAFREDYKMYRKTGEQIYTLEKYHYNFQTFGAYQKLLNNVKIVTNILAWDVD